MHEVLTYPPTRLPAGVKAEACRLLDAHRQGGEHPSFAAETALSYLNTLIGGHGVEGLTEHGLLYVNLGDPHRPTVVFNCNTETFLWGVCWGDLLDHGPHPAA